MSKKDADSFLSNRGGFTSSVSECTFRSNSPSRRADKTSSKSNICHICKQQFSLMFKKKDCIECHLPVCVDDSGGSGVPDSSRICNFCYKENLKNTYHFDNKDTLEKLIRDLTISKREKENKINEIASQNSKFKQLETTLKNNSIKFEQTVKNYNEKIKQEKDRNERVEESSKNLTKSVEEIRSLEKTVEDRLIKARGELEITRLNVKNLDDEKKQLEGELSELKDLIDKQVPLQMVKNLVCKICFRKIKYSFRSTLETNNMIEGSTMVPVRARRRRPDEMIKEACCSLF